MARSTSVAASSATMAAHENVGNQVVGVDDTF
jgi:hypothetical protein